MAAQNGHLEIVQALLEKEADVNIQTNNGYTALHIAAASGHTGILKSLLPKATYPLLKDIEGNTPIDLISDKHTKAELQKLIEDLKA
ncbi:MAG: ankyrin repeat domain-containing protein [Rickettsiales bacterium]|nr:ankyrin repeat domain-containing protein [Rickettsiales bacterium]